MTRREFDSLTTSDIIKISNELYRDYQDSNDPIVQDLRQLDEIDKNFLILYIAVGGRTKRLAQFLRVDIKKVRYRLRDIKAKMIYIHKYNIDNYEE